MYDNNQLRDNKCIYHLNFTSTNDYIAKDND